jgi:hypothetical protein
MSYLILFNGSDESLSESIVKCCSIAASKLQGHMSVKCMRITQKAIVIAKATTITSTYLNLYRDVK